MSTSPSTQTPSGKAEAGPTARQALVRSAEGHILRLGVVLSAIYIVGLVGVWLVSPEHAPALGALTALNVVVGRAAGMSFGYAAELGHAVVIPANMLIESIQVLIIFPLFVLSWRHLLEIRALKSFMARIEQVAEARRGILRSYGMAGLFVFVFIPFWMTGPVVGSVMGFLIGLRPWMNMAIVLTATYVAIGVWAVMLHGLSGWAATYNQYAPFGLVGALIILFVLGHLLRRRLGAC
jgi:uncharacterized membrane protein